jgi:hypothetical protein
VDPDEQPVPTPPPPPSPPPPSSPPPPPSRGRVRGRGRGRGRGLGHGRGRGGLRQPPRRRTVRIGERVTMGPPPSEICDEMYQSGIFLQFFFIVRYSYSELCTVIFNENRFLFHELNINAKKLSSPPFYLVLRIRIQVFGPPRSGSISRRYGSGSGHLYHQAKIVRKTGSGSTPKCHGSATLVGTSFISL